MDATHIQPSADSPILAFGTTSRRGGGWLWLALIVVLCGLLTLGAGWLGFNQRVEIPANTALLVAVKPSVAEQLPGSFRDALPAPWRAALATHSGWTVVLGAARTDTGWATFAIVPRWLASDQPPIRSMSHGLVSLESDQPLAGGDLFHYTEAWGWAWRYPFAQARLKLSLERIAPGFAELTSSTESILAGWNGRELQTDVAAPQAGGTPTTADVSLPSLDEAMSERVSAILLAEHPGWLSGFADAGVEVRAIHETMNADGSPRSWRIDFQQPMTEEQGRTVLAGLGVRDVRLKQLADGIVVQELVRPSATGTVFGEHPLPDQMSLILSGQQLTIGASSSTMGDAPAACGSDQALARFSQNALRAIVKNVGVMTDFSGSIRLLSHNQHLAICFE